MPLPLPDPADVAAASMPDTAAFDLLPVAVAWCDARGRWLGCNAAFVDFTGHRPGSAGSQPLPGGLAGRVDGTAGLLALLQQGMDADHVAWAGARASGQPLAARLSLRRHGSWRIATLLPQADVPIPVPSAPSVSPATHQALLQGMDSGQQLARHMP